MQSRADINSPHIVQVSANVAGKDYVIGDVHGNRAGLEQVLAHLGENDRLFIVGDLLDRGDDNPGVIDLIRQQPPGKVFCVRGNHEDLCLNALEQLASTVVRFKSIEDDGLVFLIQSIEEREQDHLQRDPNLNQVWLHAINGGGWLPLLFKQELTDGLIIVTDDGSLEYQEGSRVASIKSYLEQLPYIIYVPENHEHGRLAFKVVHADLPLSEEDILAKLAAGDVYLTDAEISYATWARDEDLYPRHHVHINEELHLPYEMITYVGHTIVSEADAAVRAGSNVVDLDVGSYASNAILLANHTDRRANVIGENNAGIEAIVSAVNTHLSEQLERMMFPFISEGNAEGVRLMLRAGADPCKQINLGEFYSGYFDAFRMLNLVEPENKPDIEALLTENRRELPAAAAAAAAETRVELTSLELHTSTWQFVSVSQSIAATFSNKPKAAMPKNDAGYPTSKSHRKAKKKN